MRIVMLGTTGYHPNQLRHTACIMLPELGVVLDAGTGMFRVRDYIRTKTLDIFLTHAHLDHVVGLTFMFDVLYEKAMERVTVHGESKKLKAITDHLFSEEIFPVAPPFQMQELSGPIQLADGSRLTYFPLQHPGGSIGYRIDWQDKSIAYVTDTTAKDDADYIAAIQGVDLLIHECYFPDGWEKYANLTGHSCTTPVARVAAAAKVKQLLLVHVNPLSNSRDPVGLPIAQRIFPNTEIAVDGMEIEI